LPYDQEKSLSQVVGKNPSEHDLTSMDCWGEPSDHNTSHSDRLTAIPLTRYPLIRFGPSWVRTNPTRYLVFGIC